MGFGKIPDFSGFFILMASLSALSKSKSLNSHHIIKHVEGIEMHQFSVI